MLSPYRTSLWGQCYDLGLLQLVRSGFSNVMCSNVEKILRSGPTLPSSIQDLGKNINATLDGNTCCDIAEAYRNDATSNARSNQR